MSEKTTHPSVEEIELSAVLAALVDAKRRYIVQEFLKLEKGTERHCSAFNLNLSKATTSHHFRKLREAGLISQTDLGNRSVATLRYDDIEQRFPGLLALIANEDNDGVTS
ncbi:Bacterial regulatory protein, arsR family [Pseudovibrio axinellae]|uniref:Bacterial regulatory protein, arsR family n=1 Tax=Pseudovibrio axinellae TaxID=989403 RepID=A0A165XQA0_9HYPH|nr:ArsR family transcriptional regulator [Pseudovibrio axinellae]KZL17938.1 Bacterial regulatory protein, arsR family [Pseudovibrio axinellae]SER15979.1 regulatory protein, arsR family [Pseudovibrio axinellae]